MELENPINYSKPWEVIEWCRSYAKTSWPINNVLRFHIGVYQVNQAMKWDKNLIYSISQTQAWCAVAIHFIGACEMVDAEIDPSYMDTWHTWVTRRADTVYDNQRWAELMFNVSGAAQHHWYLAQAIEGTVRKTRGDKGLLAKYTVAAICSGFLSCRMSDVPQGFELEMNLLRKKAWLTEKSPAK